MSLEKLTTRIPYVISGFFALTVVFYSLTSFGVDLFLFGEDPCAKMTGTIGCAIKWSPLPLSLVLSVINFSATLVLLAVQLTLHIISWFKK